MSSKPAAIPQNDNVAHALAGAGGGILSMALTFATLGLSRSRLPSAPVQ